MRASECTNDQAFVLDPSKQLMYSQALALGADAVLLGRPVMYGLALDGQKGVERILDLLKRELELAMGLSGCSSLKDISKDLVMTYPASML